MFLKSRGRGNSRCTNHPSKENCHWLKESSSLAIFDCLIVYTESLSLTLVAALYSVPIFFCNPGSKAGNDNCRFLSALWNLVLQDCRCWKLYFASSIVRISIVKGNVMCKKKHAKSSDFCSVLSLRSLYLPIRRCKHMYWLVHFAVSISMCVEGVVQSVVGLLELSLRVGLS